MPILIFPIGLQRQRKSDDCLGLKTVIVIRSIMSISRASTGIRRAYVLGGVQMSSMSLASQNFVLSDWSPS